MAASHVAGGLIIFALCIVLFMAGIQMDRDALSARHQANTPVRMSVRRSIYALLSKGVQSRAQGNETTKRYERLQLTMRGGGETAGEFQRAQADLRENVNHRPLHVATADPVAARRLSASTVFTRERAHDIATNGQIILTFVNRIRLDFAVSWMAHVKRLGLSNWMIGATDATALKELQRIGAPCFDMSTNLPEGEWPWGSPSFKVRVLQHIGTNYCPIYSCKFGWFYQALGPHKIELIYKSISWDLEVANRPVHPTHSPR